MDVIVILSVGELVRWCSIQAYTLMEERIFESLWIALAWQMISLLLNYLKLETFRLFDSVVWLYFYKYFILKK